jgi:hypothetical protein
MGMAWVAEMLPGAPVTRNQVELMEIDTVALPTLPWLRRCWSFAAADGSGPGEHTKGWLIRGFG